jgi:hypothetical protein
MRSSTCASRVGQARQQGVAAGLLLVLAEGGARLVEHALDQAEQLVFLEGLLDEVHRALLHRRHRHRHVAVAGDEDDRQRALALEQPVLQFQPLMPSMRMSAIRQATSRGSKRDRKDSAESKHLTR